LYSLLHRPDHGNAEQMKLADGSPMTAHTTNPVPCMVIGAGNLKLRSDGKLSDIAPTNVGVSRYFQT